MKKIPTAEETITAEEYLKSIREFFDIPEDDENQIQESASKQLEDFTSKIFASDGYVYLREEGGDHWFRMTNDEYDKI